MRGDRTRHTRIHAPARAALLAATVGGLFAAGPATAGVITWDGGGSDNRFILDANWNPNGAPTDGDDLEFKGTTRLNPINSIPDLEVRSIFFSDPAGSFTIGSIDPDNTANGAFDLSIRTDGNANGINNNSSETQTFDIGIELRNDQRFRQSTAAGSLIFKERISTSGNALTFDTAAGSSSTISGQLAGGGSLTKTGDGTLRLTNAANNYSGDTFIDGGTLEVSADLALGAGSGLLVFRGGTFRATVAHVFDREIAIRNAGGTIDVAGGNLIHEGLIRGSGGLTKTGAGELVLVGENTYRGFTLIEGGTLIVSANNNLGAVEADLRLDGGTLRASSQYSTKSGSFTTNRTTELKENGGTFQIDNNKTLTHTGAISGTGGLTKTGAGTLVLSGSNTYEGDTVVRDGTLSVSANENLGGLGDDEIDLAASSLTLNGSTLHATETFTATRSTTLNNGATFEVDDGKTLTHDGIVGGTGGLTKTGAGTMVLTEPNTYSGGTTINGGTVEVKGNSGLGDNLGALSFDGGTLRVTGGPNRTISRAITLNGGGGAFDNDNGKTLTLTGVIDGIGDLTKTGAGTLVLVGNNTYTGDTAIAGGILRIGAANRIADGSDVDVSAGATFDLNSFNETVRALSGDGAITLGTGTLTTHTATGSTFDGVISGDGGLTKVGIGTLTLTGANTYRGNTTITGGTLSVATDENLGEGSSRLTLDGGTLSVSDSFTSNRGSTLAGNGGIIDIENTKTLILAGVINGAGGLTKTGAGTLELTKKNKYAGATSIVEGTLRIDGNERIANGSDINVSAGATFDLNGFNETVGTLSGSGAITLGTGPLTTNATTDTSFGGVISGDGSLTKTGAGTLTLTADNDYSGGTFINGGTLEIDLINSLGDSTGTLSFDGGTLRVTGETRAIGRVTTLNDGGGTIQVAGTTLTHSGFIGGTGGLTKIGGGTLELGKKNTYTGLTAVVKGTLRINGNERIADESDVDVSAGATFDLNGFNETVGALSGNGSIALGTGTLTTNAATDTTFGGIISGTGGLTKLGAGTLLLTGDNIYTGTTSVFGGTLRIGATERIADGSDVSVSTGSTFDLNSFNETVGTLSGNGSITLGTGTLTTNAATDTTFGGVIGGTGGLIKRGAGTLKLTNKNTYTGNTTIAEGTLRIRGNQRIADGSDISVSSGATFDLNGFNETVGALNGNGSITLGAGTLTTNTATNKTFNGVISGTGGLTKTGAGTLKLTDKNTYTGLTSVAEGTLRIVGNQRIADESDVDVSTGATFDLNGFKETVSALSGDGSITLGTGRLTTNTATDTAFDGVIGGRGGLTKTGIGTLTLTGDNTYTGATSITGGTLRIGADERIADNSDVDVSTGATLDLNGFNETVGALSGTGSIALGTGTLTTNAATDTTFDGVISGDGGLTKTGAGTLTLTQDTNWNGNTNIAEGGLKTEGTFNNAAALNNDGTFTVTAGGLVTGAGSYTQTGGQTTVNGSMTQASIAIDGGTLGGSGTVTAALSVGAGGTVGPGNSPGLMQVFGDADFVAGSTLAFELGGLLFGTEYDRLDVADDATTTGITEGNVSLADGTVFDIDWFGGFMASEGDSFDVLVADDFAPFTLTALIFDFTGAALVSGLEWSTSLIDFGGGREALRLTVVAEASGEVPEPAPLLILLFGAAALVAARRRRAV